jgi:hypothetical protein
MFDFNLKPIPKAEPTQLSNSGSYTSSMNPQLVSTHSLLRNDNRRNTKANLPLGDGFAFGSGSSLFAEAPAIEGFMYRKSKFQTRNFFTEGYLPESNKSIHPSSRSISGFNYPTDDNVNFLHGNNSFLDSTDLEVWQADNYFCYRFGTLQNNKTSKKMDVVTRQESLFIGRANELQPLVVTSSELVNGQLRVEIRDSKVKSLYMQYFFKSIGSEGWIPDTPITDVSKTPIPFDTPLHSIGYVLAAQWIGINYAMTKRVNSTPEASNSLITKRKKSGEEILNRTPFGNCDDGNHCSRHIGESTGNIPCFPHDFKCTFGNIITPDGRLYIYLPCSTVWGWTKKLFGSDDPVGIEINVLECCQEHDISLWCSRDRFGDALVADQKVVDCVTGAIIKQGLKKAPWGCLIIDIFLFGTELAYALGGGYVLAKLVALFTIFFHNECLLNLDGQNNDSCLCGGTRPTVMCCDECENMCTKAGKGQDCIPCSINCTYIKGSGLGQGQLGTSVIEPFGINYNKLGRYTKEEIAQLNRCCPDTNPRLDLGSLSLTSQGYEEKSCNLEPNCPKCYDCGWECVYNKNNKKWGLVARTENTNNLPCCEGSLDRDISAERDCRNKNKGKGELWEPV